MHVLPPELINSLRAAEGFDEEQFRGVHQESKQITSIRINPLKADYEEVFSNFTPGISSTPIPWSARGYYLDQRPSFTLDPFFHAGCYYVQEPGSMFLEQVMMQIGVEGKNLRVLDLSASPGGKSTHLLSLISRDSLLVSNEVIRSRASVLRDNLVKWGHENFVIASNDPSAFSALPSYFDVVLVDAPCSGSGLFRKDPEAISEWSIANVQLCSGRQKRILKDVLPSLKKNGYLIYSTCSYSVEENEWIVEWLSREFDLEQVPIEVKTGWKITRTSGLRFYPYAVDSEGFFISLLRKKDGADMYKPNPGRKKFHPAEKLLVDWIDMHERFSFELKQQIHVFASVLEKDLEMLLNKLNVLHAGVCAGNAVRGKWIPDHHLAMSMMVSSNVPDIDLDLDRALLYLRKMDPEISQPGKGWHTVSYKGKRLGWINAVQGRINNYYPKSMRILKQTW